MRRTATWAIVLGFLAVPAATAADDRPCPPDIDCSGQVDVLDLVTVITDWGLSGSAADVDGSGVVEVGDLVEVITGWGGCVFAYDPPRENAEAEQIAFEMLGPNGSLLVEDEDYERIDRDLGLMRDAFPELQGQTHSIAWAPNRVIVGVVQGAETVDYECRNVFQQVTDATLLFSFGGVDYLVLTMAGKVNVEALSTLYAALDEVNSAEPDGLIGGQNFWTPTPQAGGVWRWQIDDGWHDCFDGCDCHRVYVIEIDDVGTVELISIEEFGQPWCDFGS